MENVVILGSTGSIGCSTLAVIDLHRDKYRIFALSGHSQLDKLVEQCVKYVPKYVVITDLERQGELVAKLKLYDLPTTVLSGVQGLNEVVADGEADIVMSAIVGTRGLLPTYHALKAGKKVLLANKESLIAAGQVITGILHDSKAMLIPVDSEHSAIFQCLPTSNGRAVTSDVRRIILTASGGPFRLISQAEIANKSAAEAVLHPNWSMGKKISVDSSTLMNKGLEVIEAYWLFTQHCDQIEVVIHPQSIIHSMVEYEDSSVIAQLGTPDMRTPISYALAYPKRIESGSKYVDFKELSSLTFEVPDYERFPCLNLAFRALKEGGVAPAVLNAANEIAVDAFIANQVRFYDINALIANALDKYASSSYSTIEEILEVDTKVRQSVLAQIAP